MQNLDNIIDILDRDDSLQLDNSERTHPENRIPSQVDWDKLFPPEGMMGDERDNGEQDPWREQL